MSGQNTDNWESKDDRDARAHVTLSALCKSEVFDN